MNRIGFPRSRMNEEKRIAILPEDIKKFIDHPGLLYFERGYGSDYEISDSDYSRLGSRIVSPNEAYSLEVLCQPKFCKDDIPNMSRNGQIVFGWLHLTYGEYLANELMKRGDTAIGWEGMGKDGKHLFKDNNRLTGEVGVFHGLSHGLPYTGKHISDCNVAVIGRGNVGNGAMNVLTSLSPRNIDVYDRKNSQGLKHVLGDYDVVVNCACSPIEILSGQDLRNMKPNALLIDIGDGVGVDFYTAQSIYTPILFINDGKNPVYCVNHVPTLVYRTATRFNSQVVAPYLNLLANEKMDDVLRGAITIDQGRPILEKL